ncbi:hypothetical protein AAC387_Pa06g0348 [Persea americana]
MEDMSLSVNGQSRVPPGFRFHPTEEELLHYYLRKKVAYEKIDLDVIRDVDLNKLEPWDIQEKCKIGSTPQNDWYFFSHKDKKYPTGTRTNRATAAGFWKATGRDKVIYTSFKRIGMRKTLVFYKGRAPHGQKSDWIMHEYRLDDHTDNSPQANASSSVGESTQEEGCLLRPIETNMGNGVYERSMQLPPLDSPTVQTLSGSSQSCYTPGDVPAMATGTEASVTDQSGGGHLNPVYPVEQGISDWATLDRLLASQFNGHGETSRQLASCFNDPNLNFCSTQDQDLPLLPYLRSRSFNPNQDYNSDNDLWNFGRSSSL